MHSNILVIYLLPNLETGINVFERSRTKIMIRLTKINMCPGWCGSGNGEPAFEPKGPWFNSQSGNMPGLLARSPMGGTQEATTH